MAHDLQWLRTLALFRGGWQPWLSARHVIRAADLALADRGFVASGYRIDAVEAAFEPSSCHPNKAADRVTQFVSKEVLGVDHHGVTGFVHARCGGRTAQPAMPTAVSANSAHLLPPPIGRSRRSRQP